MQTAPAVGSTLSAPGRNHSHLTACCISLGGTYRYHCSDLLLRNPKRLGINSPNIVKSPTHFQVPFSHSLALSSSLFQNAIRNRLKYSHLLFYIVSFICTPHHNMSTLCSAFSSPAPSQQVMLHLRSDLQDSIQPELSYHQEFPNDSGGATLWYKCLWKGRAQPSHTSLMCALYFSLQPFLHQPKSLWNWRAKSACGFLGQVCSICISCLSKSRQSAATGFRMSDKTQKKRQESKDLLFSLLPHVPYGACGLAFWFPCFRKVLKSLPRQPLRMRAHSSRAKSPMQSSWQSAEVQRNHFDMWEVFLTARREFRCRFCLLPLLVCLFCLSKRTGRHDQN